MGALEAAKNPKFLSPAEWANVVESLPLTRRQKQIVQLILQAKQQKEIAAALKLSKHTVHAYMGQIFHQLEVTDRTELMLMLFACRDRSLRSSHCHR